MVFYCCGQRRQRRKEESNGVWGNTTTTNGCASSSTAVVPAAAATSGGTQEEAQRRRRVPHDVHATGIDAAKDYEKQAQQKGLLDEPHPKEKKSTMSATSGVVVVHRHTCSNNNDTPPKPEKQSNLVKAEKEVSTDARQNKKINTTPMNATSSTELIVLRPSTEATAAITTATPENITTTATATTTTSVATTTTSLMMMSSRNYSVEQKMIGSSLKEAWMEMATENPNQVEEHEIRRAIELSLLDCALVQPCQGSSSSSSRGQKKQQQSTTTISSDYQVLQIPPSATLQEIKASYRRLAIATHPDKGGKHGEFQNIAMAYRNLLAARSVHVASSSSSSPQYDDNDGDDSHRSSSKRIKSTAHWDNELKEHKDLVSELFASHSADLGHNVQKQENVRDILQLIHREAGSSNINEKQERIRNSCFYLSLAVSYLEGIGALMMSFTGINNDEEFSDVSPSDIKLMQEADAALISQTALQLKRTIEGAVLKAHPEWAQQGLVGEEVQAFSDFLVYSLESDTILTDWAVAIFDETSGFVDVYKGCEYGSDGKNGSDQGQIDNATDWTRRTNTLTLRFVPGHYQPLLPKDLSKRPTLEEILTTLDLEGVFYVVTDGAA